MTRKFYLLCCRPNQNIPKFCSLLELPFIKIFIKSTRASIPWHWNRSIAFLTIFKPPETSHKRVMQKRLRIARILKLHSLFNFWLFSRAQYCHGLLRLFLCCFIPKSLFNFYHTLSSVIKSLYALID